MKPVALTDCQFCGLPFVMVWKSHGRKGRQRYCDDECRHFARQIRKFHHLIERAPPPEEREVTPVMRDYLKAWEASVRDDKYEALASELADYVLAEVNVELRDRETIAAESVSRALFESLLRKDPET